MISGCPVLLGLSREYGITVYKDYLTIIEESRQITVDRHGRSLKLEYKVEQKRQAVTVQRRLQWLD